MKRAGDIVIVFRDAGTLSELGKKGLLSLILAFAYGFQMANLRTKTPEVAQPLLLQAHRSALWEGFMLLGLNWAVALSGFGGGVLVLAAALLVTGSFLAAVSNFLNWRQKVADQFAARSQGFRAAGASTVPASVGVPILLIGVFKGL